MFQKSIQRVLIGCSAAGLLAVAGAAQAQVFQRVVGFQSDEAGYHVENTNDGGFISTGYRRQTTTTLADVMVVKHDPLGHIQWKMGFGTPNTSETGYSVRELANGYIVACETGVTTNQFGIGLIRLDPAGNVMWARVYPGTPNTDQIATPLPGVAVRELDNGGFVVVGHRIPATGGPQRGVVILTDPNGNPVWIREYADTLQNPITFTDVRPSISTTGLRCFDISGIYSAPGNPRDRDVLVLRVDAATGAVVWANRFATISAATVQETGDGLETKTAAGSEIVVVGRNDFGAPGTEGMQLFRLGPAGNLLTNRRERGIETAYAAVRYDRAGDILWAGRRTTTTQSTDAVLQNFSAGAGPLWTMAYTWNNNTTADGVCLSNLASGPDRIAMVGSVGFNSVYGQNDEYLVATDANGRTGSNCPEVPFQPPVDVPQIRQTPVTMVVAALQESTFWSGRIDIPLMDPAECVPPPTCDADFNCDGNVDQGDVDCLINLVAGNPACACLPGDFNNDGNIDQGDVDALITVVAGGPCP